MNAYAQKNQLAITLTYIVTMKRLAILTLLLFAAIICNSQNSADRIDSFINKIGKKKNNTYGVRTGNNRNDTVFFYLKKRHKTFSILERKTIPATEKRIDSIYWIWYFFIDEKLAKVSYHCKAPHEIDFHVADLYFENSILLEKKEFKKTTIPHINEILNDADILHTKSKKLTRKKYP